MDMIAGNIRDITDKMYRTLEAASRKRDDATLIAVSKMQPDDKITAALAAGQRVFGENRVQEAMARWAHRRQDYPDLQLHLIGPLQTNKVKQVVALFDVIHTVDRPKLAHALADEMTRQNRQLTCLIQVNTGDEMQKAGVSVAGLPDLLALCHDLALDIRGLMCIPPVDDAPEGHFQMLADLASRHNLDWLSMGMSDDFEAALRCGATHIRVGSRLFGHRSE